MTPRLRAEEVCIIMALDGTRRLFILFVLFICVLLNLLLVDLRLVVLVLLKQLFTALRLVVFILLVFDLD